MSYKEQNEILQRIREVEKTINFNLTTTTNSISEQVRELKSNFDLLNSKIESLEINYNEYKLKVDKKLMNLFLLKINQLFKLKLMI